MSTFKSGDKRVVRVTGSKRLNTLSVPQQDGSVISTQRFWNEGITTKGETIGFVANENLVGHAANVMFQAQGDKYNDRAGVEQAIRADRWQFSTASNTADLLQVKTDLNIIMDLGL